MNPIRTLVLTLALLAAGAAAQTLYFFPPDDPKWIAGRAYISQGDRKSAIPLTLDSTRCGWYKASIPSSSPLRNYAQFWLGAPGKDRIAPNGRMSTDFESEEDFENNGEVFKLGDIFTQQNSNNIYFVADELDPSDPNAGWYKDLPDVEDPSRCQFELAAFIYDTDISVHPDFSCGEYSMGESGGNGDNTKPNCTLTSPYSTVDAYTPKGNLKGKCTGVRQGVVQSTLGDDRKIKYNESGDKWNCWTSGDWFDKAFKATEGVNVERCYNMPFTQVKSGASAGSFEFDSDKLKNANDRIVGGFFPLLLTNRDGGDYSKCPNCDAKRPAQNFAPLVKQVSPQVFDNYTSKNGDFSDGDHPTLGEILGTAATTSVWNWANPNDSPDGTAAGTREGMNWYLHGNTAIKGTEMAPANLFFCFESHADFYYDPSQVFYFRGDDDIWIYINKKLAIDLGGTHLAAPGKIDLGAKAKDLGLEEGELYPIDIFFCDRRSTMSNVRISTNMYIAQKSNFFAKPESKENYMCANIQKGADCASKMSGNQTGGKEMCGPQLINDGYGVDFYMIQKGSKDTIWLSDVPKNAKGKRGECNGSGNTFSCYGGIKVDKAVYSCGDRYQCKGSATAVGKLVNLAGSFSVYARLTENGTVVANSKPILLDNFKTVTNTRIVWGNLESEDEKTKVTLNDAYDKTTTENQSIIVGKRTPIYIASGSGWADDSHKTFIFDNDPESAGRDYAVQVSGGKGLTLYKSKEGSEKKSSGSIPASGIDTIWVEGDFSLDDAEFSLNVVSESADAPSLKLTVYQPKLRFADSTFKPIDNPKGYTRWTNGNPEPPFVGRVLDMYVVAWDDKRGEICSHCEFVLGEKGSSEGDCSEKVKGKGENIVLSSGKPTIKDGQLKIGIHGSEDTGASGCTASWEIYSQENKNTSVKWTELRFKEPPVPVPLESFIADRNGDGIGDSVIVKFSKSLSSGDSLLPIVLGIVWDTKGKDTVYYYLPGHDLKNLLDENYVKGKYNRDFFSENRKYWSEDGHKVNDSLIIITRNREGNDDAKFSKAILTFGLGAQVLSHTAAADCQQGKDCPVSYGEYVGTLQDRISPIVVAAKYNYDKDNSKNCDDPVNGQGCYEKLTVSLSEPVYGAEGISSDDFKVPFSYCFISQGSSCPGVEDNDRYRQGWDNNDWKWELAEAAKRAKYNNKDEAKGDSVADLAYYSFRLPSGGTSKMPKAGDWIRLSKENKVLVDADGNAFNPKERGVAIGGTNPVKEEQIKVATVDPEKPPLNGMLEDPNSVLSGDRDHWISDAAIKEQQGGDNKLYKDGNVAEFLPVPKDGDYGNPDSIAIFYPGSVGTVFKIADDLSNSVSNFASTCEGCDIKNMSSEELAGRVTIRASAYYHTNLGDYTAHRSSVAANCKDPIFQYKNKGGNCLSNFYNYYLAWDLRANNGRFVGAGAYVGVTKFYVELEYNQNGSKKTKKFNVDDRIEMYGARRKK